MSSTTTLPLQTLQSLMSPFLIPDLQTLLTFAGQSKYGRKAELRERVMDLLKSAKWSRLIEIKILQILREVKNRRQVVNNACHDKSNCYSCCNNLAMINTPANRAVDSNVEIMGANRAADSNVEIMGANRAADSNVEIMGANRAADSNVEIMGANRAVDSNVEIRRVTPQQIFLYTQIKFKELPFYEFLQEIVSPCLLTAKRTLPDSCEFHCRFSLSSDVALKIRSSLCTDIDNPTYAIELQLRMCKLGSEVEYADDLPLCIDVTVNNQSCNLPPTIPSTNKLLKRFGAPIIITRQASTDFNNVIMIISWNRRYVRPTSYAMAIHLVRKRDCEELLQMLQSKDVGSCSTTKTLIKKNMESDDDIIATSLKVSLACPLGKIRMTLPCRATTCQHFQCFDAGAYLKMNKVKPTWLCPICNQACLFQDLIIDGYFIDILKSGKFKDDSDDIWLYGDGSWMQIDLNKSSQNSSEKQRKRSFVGKRNSAAVISDKRMDLSSHRLSTSTPSSSSKDLSTASSQSPNVHIKRMKQISASCNKKLTPLLVDLTNDTEEPAD